MLLIVGLGNPGPEYARTRHNAGFMVVERLAARHRLAERGPVKSKFHAGVLEGEIAGQRAMLMQPMTFMNHSGLAVGEAVAFYKLELARDLMVVVDDLALPVGKIRLRPEGGTGGHNGLADIQRALGTPNYPRLRVGIDSRGQAPQVDYVLGRFTPEQQIKLEPALELACDALECWIKEGLGKAMSLYNSEE